MNISSPSTSTITPDLDPYLPNSRSHHSLSRKRRILLAEDDEPTRHLYCVLLSRAGYDVDAASDGEHAWEALTMEDYDLLLTDHNMPYLTGLELVEKMRTAGIALPTIIHSGWLNLGQISDYPHLNLCEVLPKSLDLLELVAAIERVLPPSPDANPGTIRMAPRIPQLGVLVPNLNVSSPEPAAAPNS